MPRKRTRCTPRCTPFKLPNLQGILSVRGCRHRGDSRVSDNKLTAAADASWAADKVEKSAGWIMEASPSPGTGLPSIAPQCGQTPRASTGKFTFIRSRVADALLEPGGPLDGYSSRARCRPSTPQRSPGIARFIQRSRRWAILELGVRPRHAGRLGSLRSSAPGPSRTFLLTHIRPPRAPGSSCRGSLCEAG